MDGILFNIISVIQGRVEGNKKVMCNGIQLFTFAKFPTSDKIQIRNARLVFTELLGLLGEIQNGRIALPESLPYARYISTLAEAIDSEAG